jgi:hypothetical protein
MASRSQSNARRFANTVIPTFVRTRNCRGGSKNWYASSFVTTGIGVFGAGLVRGIAFLGRGRAAMPQVRPGMASKAALSVNGGRWDPAPTPKGGAVGCEVCGGV